MNLNPLIPAETLAALENLKETLGLTLVAVYLYGSAVAGGLRPESDVDIMAVVNQRLSEAGRKGLAGRLLRISGKIGNPGRVRSLEVTIVNLGDIVPWQYPPRKEFIYGEWLRAEFERGDIPEPDYDPDLAILLRQVLGGSIPLAGPAAPELLERVPDADVRSAMRDCLPGLVQSTRGDERNVILTLARMWVTAAEGRFLPKDAAAEWALPRLPGEEAALLELAARAYRGEAADRWAHLGSRVDGLVDHLGKEIKACLELP